MKKNILIVILGLVIIGLGGVIFYQNNKKVTKTNVVKDNNSSKEEEVLDVNGRVVMDLYNEVVISGDSFNKYWYFENNDNYLVENASEESKMALLYHNLKQSDFKSGNHVDSGVPLTVKVKNFYRNNEEEAFLAKQDTQIAGDYYISSQIDYDKVNLLYKKIFGSDKAVDKSIPMQISNFGGFYIYNDTVKAYILYLEETGGTSMTEYRGTVTKAIKNKDSIVITEKVELVDTANNSVTEVGSYNYTFKKDTDTMYSFVSRIKE